MRAEKQLLLDEIQDKIEGGDAFIIASYQALSANHAQNLRQAISETGGDFEVVKKRVLVKAAENLGISLDLDELRGHIGIVIAGEDVVASTKAVFKFRKENENALEVLGGHFDGKLIAAKEVETLSTLPSMDVMRAQFLGLLEAPMSQTLSVVEALLTSVLHCLENKSKASSGEG